MTGKIKIKVLLSETYDPWFNLATEDWIFNDMDPQTHILFLWRNEETVVIGRYQNPWVECNLPKMNQDKIKLARRQSGGGAVFHDLGNTNFTFLSSKENFSKEVNNSIILKAISQFKVNAEASGRNDIVVDGHKVSGSAFKEKKDRAFHHGTLLIDANLQKLANYLRPRQKKLVSKGIKSVRARVANLNSFNKYINHDNLSRAIIHEFFNHYQQECPIEVLSLDFLKNIPELKSYYEKLADWNWRFGETPQFKHYMEERFQWGQMDVHLDSQKGMISDAVIYSDSLHPDMIEKLTQKIKEVPYEGKALASAVNELSIELPMFKDYLGEFSNWISSQVK